MAGTSLVAHLVSELISHGIPQLIPRLAAHPALPPFSHPVSRLVLAGLGAAMALGPIRWIAVSLLATPQRPTAPALRLHARDRKSVV